MAAKSSLRPLKSKKKFTLYDWLVGIDVPALILILLLTITGLIALFSASYASAESKFGNPLYFINRQFKFAIFGVLLMVAISHIPYRFYFELAPGKLGKSINAHKYLFAFCIALLIMTPYIGVSANNAVRWIELPAIGQFQASELMKISLILSFSWYASQPNGKIKRFWGILPYMLVIGGIAALLYLQPHMSATVIIFMIGMTILYVAGLNLAWIPVGVVGGLSFIIWYINRQGYAMSRMLSWLDPFADLRDTGWQAANSHIAIGSGGFWGLGLGQGRQKHLFLPEPQNDFIFSSWCEEMGFIGALFVILMFAMLIYRGYYIARECGSKLGCLIVTGITSKLAIQTLLNMFVVSGITPVTGASLPFFSYGGTALVMQFIEMGILLSVSRTVRKKE